MNSLLLKSFVKEAMALQVEDGDTPPDYVMVKAAVAAKFPLLKEAVSGEWVEKKTRLGLQNASSDRIKRFTSNMGDIEGKADRSIFKQTASLYNPDISLQNTIHSQANDARHLLLSEQLNRAMGTRSPLPETAPQEHVTRLVERMHEARRNYEQNATGVTERLNRTMSSDTVHDSVHRLREESQRLIDDIDSGRVRSGIEAAGLGDRRGMEAINQRVRQLSAPIPGRRVPSLGRALATGTAAGLGTLGLTMYGIKKLQDRNKKKTKTANTPNPSNQSRWQRFSSAAKQEVGPAGGAVIGAGLANAYGVSPLAGAAAGYGLGAIPEIIHGIRHRV